MPLLEKGAWGEAKWAVWHTTESLDELYLLLPFDGKRYRLEADERFSSAARKVEFIAVRVLLYSLLKTEPLITYLDSGKPILQQNDYAISISHTKEYVAVALSPTHEVGIDIERYRDKIERLSPRFVHPHEEAPTLTAKLLHWSAKETIFKLLDQEGVDFLDHLRITPSPLTSCRGKFNLQEFRTPQQQQFEVHYQTNPQFVLTFAQGNLRNK